MDEYGWLNERRMGALLRSGAQKKNELSCLLNLCAMEQFTTKRQLHRCYKYVYNLTWCFLCKLFKRLPKCSKRGIFVHKT